MDLQELEFFLQLKYGDTLSGIKAFRKSIKADNLEDVPGMDQELLQRAVIEWCKQGAPSEFEVTAENVDAVLKIKFGSVDRAFRFWMMHEDPIYGTNIFSELEYKRLLDYTPT